MLLCSPFGGSDSRLVLNQVCTPSAQYYLDIGVMLESPLTVEQRQAMIKALAGALGRSVDLVDLNRVGEPLLGQILKEGRRLLGAPTHMAILLSRHLTNGEDFIPLQKHILETRRRAWIKS